MSNPFSVIVQPNVAPDVRPPRLPIKIETEDERDTEIIGANGQCIDLDHNQSVRASFREKQAEQFRIFDTMRITSPRNVRPSMLSTRKGTEPTGLRNYVDVEIVHYLQYRNEFNKLIVEKFAKPTHSPSRGRFVIRENEKRSVT